MFAGTLRRVVMRNMLPQQRLFATSGQAKLERALSKELEYEEQNYTVLEDTETFLQESGFAYAEQEDGLDCSLEKMVDSRKVVVNFQARQPQPEDEFDQGEEDDQMEEQDEAFQGENYCDFSVFVYSPIREQSGMIFDCTSMDTEVSINNVQFTTEMDKMRDVPRFERSFNHYSGPDFNSLDERLQTGLSDFLQGQGVNEHLAAFVEVMSLDKD